MTSLQPHRWYAIGDIHGRADLLQALHQQIQADAADFDGDITLLYLGDYVDRGPQSRQVIECLLGENPLPAAQRIFLRGNHDAELMQFCTDPTNSKDWVERWGGAATLQSYGVPYSPGRSLAQLSKDLNHLMPKEHHTFLQDLNLYHTAGDYLFVHAGVRPDIPLENQTETDLLFIKADFTTADAHNLPYIVVFGHSIFDKPLLKEDRIGVDTGAFAGGPLTAVALEKTQEPRFLQARGN